MKLLYQELNVVKVKHLNDEACEIAILTKTEDRVDVLLQVEDTVSV